MHLDTFIPAALLILLATSLSVILFKYLGLRSVLGLLAAGIAIGPHSPGPRITDNIEDIRHFAELGIVLLLFLIGLEMRPSRLWSMRRAVFGLGSLQIAVTGMLMLLVGFGRFLLPFALDRVAAQSNREGFLLVVLLAVFFASWAIHKAGVSMALGAFVMGMLLSDSRYRLQIQAALEPYKGVLMSLFFVAVGMSIDIGAIARSPLLFAQHTAVLIALKLVILVGLVLAFGFSRTVAIRVAFYLAQGGEFGFVLFGSAGAGSSGLWLRVGSRGHTIDVGPALSIFRRRPK